MAPQFLTLKFQAASVEQGKEVDLIVNVNKSTDFPGAAKLTLIGLPNKATTEPVTVTNRDTKAVFHLKTDPKTPPGESKNLFCQAVITQRRRADRAQPGHGPVAGRCAAPGQEAGPAGRRRQARHGGHRQGRCQ